MYKSISLIISVVLLGLLSSCNHDKNGITINGEIALGEFEGCTIYLGTLDNNDTIDSTTVKGGKFLFRCSVEKPMMGRIFAESNKSALQCSSTLVLEPGKIYIDLMSDSLSGTPLNDLFYSTYTANPTTVELSGRRDDCLQQYYTAEDDEAQQIALTAYKEADSLLTAHLLDISRHAYSSNTNNVLGAYALSQVVYYDGITFDSLDYLMNHAAPIVADYEPLRKARTQLFHLATTSEGKPVANIDGIDFATGEETQLSALIDTNYITLVDFWASWCSPCRQEISDNLNRLYAEYHDKGLNIIGVDVWDNVADHKAAVQKLEIAYPQLIDTVGAATEAYGIVGIPTILLLDRKGVIVKRGLRGEDIEAAIVEALGLE